MDLNDQLDEFLDNNFMNLELKKPLFYNSNIAIRYELGGDLEGKNRIDRVTLRALSIFNEICEINDMIYLTLFVDSWSDNPVSSFEKNVYANLNYYSRTRIEDIDKRELEYRYKDPEDHDDETITLQYCTKTELKNLKVKDLFEAVAHRESEPESRIEGDIYLINETKKCIFHIYDSRGMDIVATDTFTLRSVYEKYYEWILDFDRKTIDQIFNNQI
ncbi:DUF3885 domain-containing protein [Paenibacillus polysaccharolyticus]|uniref:DUF3885 domain-containing protein n=1 Tax=Paenibacillus polysaccharolyticus TaxID=582692 RepID=UPI0020A0D803|nr:DUF3885 domain-containing protein [Paenibacillus polysaccharolyticus]MCP1133616.1 DUF3885 domain-containing protein [Paenibacillus polysaccharolyticus]